MRNAGRPFLPVLVAIAVPLGGSPASVRNSPAAVQVDAASSRHAISRLICGAAFDDAATLAGLKEATEEILSTLTPREAKVLRMRFGIEMNTDHTLEEVGKQFDVTRERIRQIEAKALRKLRHPSRSEKLRSFLEGE